MARGLGANDFGLVFIALDKIDVVLNFYGIVTKIFFFILFDKIDVIMDHSLDVTTVYVKLEK